MSRQGLKLLQVSWHPGSETDSHVVFLTSDNNLRYGMGLVTGQSCLFCSHYEGGAR